MATISEVKIANMALSHIGASSSLESLAEDTPAGDAVRLWYDFSRIQALESFDWSFARKRLTLAAHSDDPPEGIWTFRYQYPADCVAFRRLPNPLGPSADLVPFEVELGLSGVTKTILTDLEDAVGVYTMDLELTSLYSAFFVEALSYVLAHHLAYPITGKLSLEDRMMERFNQYISLAPAQNANEGVERLPREAVHIRARD